MLQGELGMQSPGDREEAAEPARRSSEEMASSLLGAWVGMSQTPAQQGAGSSFPSHLSARLAQAPGLCCLASASGAVAWSGVR